MKKPLASAKRRAALLVLVSAQFVIMLDTSIVNVVLPSIQRELGLGQTGTAWVANAYLLSFGGFLLLSGRAADVFGRLRMFVAGAAVFSAASLMAGFAASESMLLLARLSQGLGAAVLSPAALSIILVLFTGSARTKAMGAWGAASAAGGAVGVFAGGMISASLGWQWVFFLPLPVCLLALLAAPVLFSRISGNTARRRFDAAGAFTVTGGSVAVVYAVLAAADHGWASVQTIGGTVLGLALFLAFVLIERRAGDPIVPLGLFHTRQVSVGMVVGLLGGAGRVSSFFLVALWLQQALQYGPREAGVAMLPTSLAVFAMSLLVLPRLVRRIGPVLTLTTGMAMLAGGLFWLSLAPADAAAYAVNVLPGLLLSATGIALSFMPSTMVITSGVPAGQAGLASGMASAAFQIGGALGVAACSAVASLRAQEAASAGASLTQSLAQGYQGAFVTAGFVSLLTAATALFLLRRTPKGNTREEPAPATRAAPTVMAKTSR